MARANRPPTCDSWVFPGGAGDLGAGWEGGNPSWEPTIELKVAAT